MPKVTSFINHKLGSLYRFVYPIIKIDLYIFIIPVKFL